jgi:hypothetical protein
VGVVRRLFGEADLTFMYLGVQPLLPWEKEAGEDGQN